MGSRWRAFVEGILPWFDAAVEHRRDRHTEAIRRRSIATRVRAERVIDDYERAEAEAGVHGRRLIAELRRDDDR